MISNTTVLYNFGIRFFINLEGNNNLCKCHDVTPNTILNSVVENVFKVVNTVAKYNFQENFSVISKLIVEPFFRN